VDRINGEMGEDRAKKTPGVTLRADAGADIRHFGALQTSHAQKDVGAVDVTRGEAWALVSDRVHYVRDIIKTHNLTHLERFCASSCASHGKLTVHHHGRPPHQSDVAEWAFARG
jgi:hypothetical protein